MSNETRDLSDSPYAGGGGSDTRDLIDAFGTIPTNPPWVLRRMQLLACAHAADADDARDLLGALGLLEPIEGGEG